jgi:RimJ/RimL family protein N-acetyltransferase
LDDLAGIGVISLPREIGGRHQGDSSEMFFREYHRTDTPEFACLLLDWAFSTGGMDVLRGITPCANLPALRFMKMVGYEFTQPIPELCEWQGKPCAGVISWMTKEMWAAKKANRSVV